MRSFLMFLLVLSSSAAFCQEVTDTIHFPADKYHLPVYRFIDTNKSNDTVYVCYHPCPFLTKVSQMYDGMFYTDFIISHYPMIVFKCESERKKDIEKYTKRYDFITY